MIFYTMKMSVKKMVAGALAVGAVTCGAVALVSSQPETSAMNISVSTTDIALMNAKAKDNESRIELLASLGWNVGDEPLIEREVQIPKVFDETYKTYNELQLAQGLDLIPYQGKRATLYTYELTEYPSGESGVVANLLVRRGKLIAADISSADADGFIHGIIYDYNAQGEQTQSEIPEDGEPQESQTEQTQSELTKDGETQESRAEQTQAEQPEDGGAQESPTEQTQAELSDKGQMQEQQEKQTE